MSRIDSVNELLKHEVSEAILRVKEPDFGFVTVTSVETQRDLKKAIVWVSILSSDPKASFKVLKFRAYEIQDLVSQKIKFKFTPKLEFRLDETGTYVSKINEMIEEIKKDDKKE